MTSKAHPSKEGHKILTETKVCSACGAETFNYDTGKCKKCGYTATLEAYGFEIHRMRNKTFILTEKGEADPLSTFSNVTSRLEKKNVARLTGAPLAVVEHAFAVLAVEPKEKPKTKSNKENDKESFSEETTIKAWELLREPSFFFKLGRVFSEGFIVPKINKPRFVLGEERNKRLLGPLTIGAAKLGMTSIIRVIGTPGTAKDTMVRMWLKLLGLSYLERSYLTAAAIRYSQNIQESDLLYIPDTPRMQGEAGRQMLFMRSDDGGLISEYATRDTETGEMTTKTVTLPIKGVVTTSNEIIAGAALVSGMWTLSTNADLKLTEDVKKEKLKMRAGRRSLLPDVELEKWQCAFKILLNEELPENGVTIPYASELINVIGSERSESRRDPDKLCDLIALIAWIRRFQKPKEERELADVVDLYIALQIGLDAIRETMLGLSEKETQIFEALIKLCSKAENGATVRGICDYTKIPYKTVYRILEESLLDKGYATKDKVGTRNFYRNLSEKTNSSFPFSEGRNKISSDDVIAFVSGVIRNFSPSHGNTEAKIFVVDPVTGESVTFDNNGSVKVEKFLPSQSGENVRNGESGIKQASNGKSDPKTFLPEEKGKEKVIFYVKKVKPAEPCEQCGKFAVEIEIVTPQGETLRKCSQCFEQFRVKRKAEWKAKE